MVKTCDDHYVHDQRVWSAIDHTSRANPKFGPTEIARTVIKLYPEFGYKSDDKKDVEAVRVIVYRRKHKYKNGNQTKKKKFDVKRRVLKKRESMVDSKRLQFEVTPIPNFSPYNIYR